MIMYGVEVTLKSLNVNENNSYFPLKHLVII